MFWFIVICVYSFVTTCYIVYLHCMTLSGCLSNIMFCFGCVRGCCMRVCERLKYTYKCTKLDTVKVTSNENNINLNNNLLNDVF